MSDEKLTALGPKNLTRDLKLLFSNHGVEEFSVSVVLKSYEVSHIQDTKNVYGMMGILEHGKKLLMDNLKETTK